MIAVSTAWNAERHAGWAPAVRELLDLGHLSVALEASAIHADAAAAGRAVRAGRGQVEALFAPAPRRLEVAGAEGLVSPRPERRAVAVAAAAAAGGAALASGTQRVVLRVGELPEVDASRETNWLQRLVGEGGAAVGAEVRDALQAARRDRDRFVEALCRALFELSRALPDVQWFLETPSRTSGFPFPHEAETVFGELPGRRIAYWHDAGHAARLSALSVVPAEQWLATLGPRSGGVTIADWSPTAADLPPGAGIVDWKALRAQLTDAMPRVLRLDPSFPAPLLNDALREARALGL